MGELLYDIWLSILPGMSADRKMDLIRAFGSAKALWKAEEEKIREAFSKYGFLSTHSAFLKRLLQKDLYSAKRCLRDGEKLDAGMLSFFCRGYPGALKGIKDPPLVLFALGDVSLLQTRCVAIVGTRRASPYGKWAAGEMGKRIALAGVTVVSGMAEGIDSAAHAGCLRAGGKTIAVFGTGVDVCFPKSNADLYREIREKGLLLSEYPFGQWGYASNFPERNRIIAGLSESCIVAEGAVKSGSLITAGLAAEQGRNVFALPGNINQPGSAGTNLLLSEGVPPIVSMEDLLHTLGLAGLQARERTDLSGEEKRLMKWVSTCGSSSRQYVCEGSGLPFSEANALLVCLELKGLVRLEGNQVFIL